MPLQEENEPMLDHLGSLSPIKRKVNKPVPVDDKMDGFEWYHL